ncbi:MAG: hypothetical protein ACTSUE_15540 [Promethearchaeota archaeon]
MPAGLFILAWDIIEGAVVSERFPGDLQIDIDAIQSIEISHQFNKEKDFNWIILEDKHFKAVSFFDPGVQKALVLVLKSHDEAKDYVDQLKELANFILHIPVEQDITARLEESLKMFQAKISTSEVVLMSFGQKIQELEGEKLDMIERLETIIKVSNDLDTKLLILLVIQSNGVCIDEITRHDSFSQYTADKIKQALAYMEKRSLVTYSPDSNLYRINPKIDLVVSHSHSQEPSV